MDIAASSLVNALTPAAAADAAPVAADPLATARFAELMGGAPPAVADPSAPAANPPALPPPGERSVGDAVLAGMQNLSGEFKASWQMVQSTLDSGQAMTLPDMLKMQMGLAQMSIQHELIGKAVSRSAQNLDQLVKLQ